MALISMREVGVSFGGAPLLDGVNLQIEGGERICLVGRNGAGKSTLMRLIKGDVRADAGEIIRSPGVKISLLPQEVPQGLQGTIAQVVAGGLLEDGDGAPVAAYEGAGWREQLKVDQIMSLMNLAPDILVEALSAGLKRRVMLARGLVRDPDVLLLDEPTNHLDIEAISWMEEFLLRFSGTMVLVTHDRMFLQKLATRIVELDRGNLFDWSCDYATFLKRRQAALEAEQEQWIQFDKKLAKEEAWIRHGIRARRTRNEGRVRKLRDMREMRRSRRERAASVRMRAQAAMRTGKLVIEAEDLCFGFAQDALVVRDFSTMIMRGDKVGIIGPNGAGKTTLLRLLLGDLQPHQGVVRHGTHLQVAYFDQLRMRLDKDKSVAENVGEGNEMILFDGKPRHVIGYLQDFLFSPQRARSPVRILSGGERNRLLLAKLFTVPCNVLVMDEPTNDLDTETLELLEELLLNFAGTLLLVSHDRAFLNNVVTSTLVFEGAGGIGEYVGGYDDWLLQRKTEPRKKVEKGPVAKLRPGPRREQKTRLNYKEQRELEGLPEQIEMLENEQKELYQTLSDPAFYRENSVQIAAAKTRIEQLEQQLHEAYARWEVLEAMSSQ